MPGSVKIISINSNLREETLDSFVPFLPPFASRLPLQQKLQI